MKLKQISIGPNKDHQLIRIPKIFQKLSIMEIFLSHRPNRKISELSKRNFKKSQFLLQ
jgi:hypothetical protein